MEVTTRVATIPEDEVLQGRIPNVTDSGGGFWVVVPYSDDALGVEKDEAVHERRILSDERAQLVEVKVVIRVEVLLPPQRSLWHASKE